MNKKVVLSVLSATFVASMAASAFAAPQSGLYIGGNAKKFYSFQTLVSLTEAGNTQFNADMAAAGGFSNLVFVDTEGKGATITEIMDLGLEEAKEDPLKDADFAENYSVVNASGQVTGNYNVRDDVEDGDTTGDLKVDSVSAINAKEVTIKFSKAVDKDSVIAGGNLTNITFTQIGTAQATGTIAAELSEDGKTLTLTAAQFFNGEYAVTVPTSVKDTDGNAIEAYSSIFKNVDATRPAVESVTYPDFETAKITFSEPLSSLGTASANLPEITVGALSADKKSVLVNLADPAVELNKDYTVTIIGAKDFNGNLINPNPVTATVKKVKADSVKPVVAEVSATNDKVFTVKFSEKLVAVPTIKVGATTLNFATTGGNATYKVDTTGTVYTITLNTAASGLQAVEVSAFKDLSGNTGETFTKVVNFAADTVDPEVSSYTFEKIGGKEYLIVKFSENVDPQPGVAITGVRVAEGVEYPSATLLTTDTVTETTAPITPANISLHNAVNGVSDTVKIDVSSLVNGQYTVKLPVGLVKDKASTPRDNKEKANVTFTRGANDDTTKPTLDNTVTGVNSNVNGIEAQATLGTDNNTILVSFNEKLDLASALNVANYKIEGVTVSKAVFTQNTTKGVVKLTLAPGAVQLDGDRLITISGVKDVAGNTIEPVTATLSLKETVAPTVTSATLVAADQIKLTFSEAVENLTASDFEVYVGTETTARAYDGTAPESVATDKKSVTVKLGAGLSADDYAKALVVKLASASDAEDANKNALSLESVTVNK